MNSVPSHAPLRGGPEQVTVGAALPRCRVFYMSAGQRVSWGWIADEGGAKCSELFPHYYDCLQDARRRGYYVDPGQHPQNVIQLRAALSAARAPAAR